MKTILLLAGALFFTSSAYSGGIISVTGPTPACPGATNQCGVNYFTNPVMPYVSPEMVIEIKWDYSQNGQVFKTLYSSSFPPGYPSGSTSITGGALPYGNVTLAVRIRTFFTVFGQPQFLTYTKSTSFFVGLAAPATMTGPPSVCPGTSVAYSCGAVAGASSYTWEVPSGWKVNGISGPIVTGQPNTASITFPPCVNMSGAVKVKAVGGCGSSSYLNRVVMVDYPVTITEQQNMDGTVTFSTNYTDLTLYSQSIPPEWQVMDNDGFHITVFTNGVEGNLSLTYGTPCSCSPPAVRQGNGPLNSVASCACTYTVSYYYVPPTPPPPPPPCCEVIQAFPNPATDELNIRSTKRIAEIQVENNGHVQRIGAHSDHVTLDVSNLTPGMHIIRVKDSSGEYRSIRFVKK